MAVSRASRRKVVAVSSDEEEESATYELPSDNSEDDEETVKPSNRSTGKLNRPTRNSSGKAQQPTPANSTQNGAGSKKSPKKAKVTVAAKGKAASKPAPKANAKPIYSFFNAATQKLQNSQTPSASPEKRVLSQDQLEAIQEDSDDSQGSGVQFSKGSKTALALRKRKILHEGSFENETGQLPSASQKFRKVSDGERVASSSPRNEDKRPWTDQFPPKDLSELAVHKRKVADVRQWLEIALNGQRQRVLVLKGSAGTGKTTTIRLLAKELGVEIAEWKNPAGGEFATDGSMSAALQFNEFVGRAGRSGGLQMVSGGADEMYETDLNGIDDPGRINESGQLLLIEEFPNTFSRTSSTLQAFRSAILQYLSTPVLNDSRPTPIIMIISETLLSTNTALADSFTTHRLLGPELSNHPFLDTIEFNAVAPTILMKALENVVINEARKTGRRRTPGPQVLKRLTESGDIRSAISSLEFLCLRGDSGDTWSSKITFTKQKKPKADPPLTQYEEEALKLISNRENTLDIFHAVGKVVYNKRIVVPSISHPPSWLPHHRRNNVPENDVDMLVDEVGTDTSTFLAALHENYALSCSASSTEDTLDSMLGCIESISDADLLSVDRFSSGTRAFSGSATDSLRQDEMAFQVSVRGLWFKLPYPVHRTLPPEGKKGDAHRMFYPTSLRLWRKKEEVESTLHHLVSKLQSGDLVTTTQAASRAGNASNAKHGVESWKRVNPRPSTHTSDDSATTVNTTTNSAKLEIVTEWLPYLSQISSRTLSPKILEQLRTVTRVQNIVARPDNEEDDDADVEVKEDANQEQWATDRPEGDAGLKSPSAKSTPKRKQAKRITAAGLGTSVASHVEKLTLEDDEIED